ncbi:MAG: hypothetical protein RLZZ465_179 [Bacteroidota bacterium]
MHICFSLKFALTQHFIRVHPKVLQKTQKLKSIQVDFGDKRRAFHFSAFQLCMAHLTI